MGQPAGHEILVAGVGQDAFAPAGIAEVAEIRMRRQAAPHDSPPMIDNAPDAGKFFDLTTGNRLLCGLPIRQNLSTILPMQPLADSLIKLPAGEAKIRIDEAYRRVPGALGNIAKAVQLLLRTIEPPLRVFAHHPRPVAVFVMLSVQLVLQLFVLSAVDFVIGQGLRVVLGQCLRMHRHGIGDVIVPDGQLGIGRIVHVGRGGRVRGVRGVRDFNVAPRGNRLPQ